MNENIKVKPMIPININPDKLPVKKFLPIISKPSMYHIKPTIAPTIAPIDPNKVKLLKFNFCLIPTNKKAAIVPTNDVIIQGNITSAGLAAFSAARYPIIEVGINVKPAACKHINIICASLALSFSGFKVCKLSMAFNPNGVAAESNPRKFAAKFKVMYEMDS